MLKKILLTLSVIALAIGFCNTSKSPQWDAGLPLGAVLFALFLIVTMLEKETALYDLEQKHKLEERNATSQAGGPAMKGLKSTGSDFSPIGKAALP